MNKYERVYKKTIERIQEGKKTPLLKVIRLKCLDCVCWQEKEVKLCPADDCILYPFRMGRNPLNRKKFTKEQKKKMADRARENFKHE